MHTFFLIQLVGKEMNTFSLQKSLENQMNTKSILELCGYKKMNTFSSNIDGARVYYINQQGNEHIDGARVY